MFIAGLTVGFILGLAAGFALLHWGLGYELPKKNDSFDIVE